MRVCVGVVALIGLLTVVSAAGARAGARPSVAPFTSSPKIPRSSTPPGIDSSLATVASIARTEGAAAANTAARADGLGVQAGLVRVIVQADSSSAGAASSAVTAAGGRVDGSYANLVEARVPPSALTTVAANPAVSLVRPPYAHHVDAVGGEEVGASNAAALQAAGVTGAGAKVAIIDVGFGGLAGVQASGDLPNDAVQVDMCPNGGYGGQVHGTAVAEIVHEMAPDAQLYLICIDDEVSLGQAEVYAKTHGITIISHSVSWFNTGRGDGSGGPGTPDAIAADAAANGILWVNSAGNYGEQHWAGSFVDGGGGLNLFSDGATSSGADGFALANGATECIFLKWDAWPTTHEDFDLFLFDYTGFVPLAMSTNDQATSGGPPTEDLCYTNTTGIDQNFYVVIHRAAATTSPRLDMWFTGGAGSIQYTVARGSITEPASSPSTFATGAICWQDNALEPYSSQGPTIDGRTKPDIAGQDSNSSATYGAFSGCGTSGFAGTSASAPAAAGAAALLASLHPGWSYTQIETALATQAVDLGSSGPDNMFGAGALRLDTPVLATQLQVAAPSAAVGGAPFSITVSALDGTGALVPGYRGTVHFTSTDGSAALPANYTFTPSDNGVHTFTNGFTLNTGGPQTVNAVDTVNAATGGLAPVDVATPDVTPPTIDLTAPADGAHYARGAGVSAAYTCSDSGGSGVATCLGTVADGSAIDTGSLGSKAFAVAALDSAGNPATVTVHYTIDDVTKPSAAIATPASGAFYKQGATVLASFACQDDSGGSGIASCVGDAANGAAIDTTSEGSHDFTATATDNAANVATQTMHYKVDGTGPAIAATLPAEGASYPAGSEEHAGYSCSDGSGSGVATCIGTAADGAEIDTTLGDHVFTIHATDAVGNLSDLTVHYHVVDVTKPGVAVAAPLEGATYPLGSTVASSFACTDETGGSGIATCGGSGGASGAALDTAAAGIHTFTVVGEDAAGNTTTVVRHYTVVTSGGGGTGGGGGGGGGGGVPPNLHVDLSASAPTPPAVGSELIYVVKVSVTNVGSSSAVRLNVTLPAGYTVTRTYTDRGAGCTGSSQALVCDVAWISQGTNTNVTIWGTVGQAGELDATATVTSLVETEADAVDNATTLKLVPAGPVLPAPTPAPQTPALVLSRVGRALATARAAHIGRMAVIRASVETSKAVSLKITAIDARSRVYALLKGSKVASVVAARPTAQLVYRLSAAGTVSMRLQIRYGLLKRGQRYAILVVGTAPDGESSRLVIPFRL